MHKLKLVIHGGIYHIIFDVGILLNTRVTNLQVILLSIFVG